MTTIVRRRWNCRMSSNLLGVAALGIAIFAGCASEEPALPPVDTTAAAITSATGKPAKPPKPATASDAFVDFESGQVRPLALSRDGQLLFAVNTPDNRLEIFAVDGPGLCTAPRCRSASSRSPSRRARTARSGSSTTSPTASASSTSAQPDARARRAHAARRRRAARHRLRRPGRSAPSSRPRTAARTPAAIRSSPRPASAAPTSGCSTRTTSGASLGGTPLTIVTLFTDTPRALAVTPDGTTRLRGRLPLRQPDHVVNERRRRRRRADGGLPAPATNARACRGRRRRRSSSSSTASSHWVDELGRTWDDQRQVHPARQGRVRDRRRRRTRRRSRGTGGFFTGVGPSSSTWR